MTWKRFPHYRSLASIPPIEDNDAVFDVFLQLVWIAFEKPFELPGIGDFMLLMSLHWRVMKQLTVWVAVAVLHTAINDTMATGKDIHLTIVFNMVRWGPSCFNKHWQKAPHNSSRRSIYWVSVCSWCGPSQWKTTLHCNVVCHWLDPYLEWALIWYSISCCIRPC